MQFCNICKANAQKLLSAEVLRSKVLEALMQFRNICEANAQKLLLYQYLRCSEYLTSQSYTYNKIVI